VSPMCGHSWVPVGYIERCMAKRHLRGCLMPYVVFIRVHGCARNHLSNHRDSHISYTRGGPPSRQCHFHDSASAVDPRSAPKAPRAELRGNTHARGLTLPETGARYFKGALQLYEVSAVGKFAVKPLTWGSAPKAPRIDSRAIGFPCKEIDSPCECEYNNPDSLDARLLPSVVAVAPAVCPWTKHILCCDTSGLPV